MEKAKQQTPHEVLSEAAQRFANGESRSFFLVEVGTYRGLPAARQHVFVHPIAGDSDLCQLAVSAETFLRRAAATLEARSAPEQLTLPQ